MEKRMLLSVGTVLQGRYEIIKLLGAGGMGAVYEAHNERTSANVALKETFATGDYEVSAFEREAKLLANLDHEALPRVMDYFAEGEGYFLVMELIRGEDLQTLLGEKEKPFETNIVLGWADQILDALEDIHSRRIVHRDIKPANIKLTPRGKIKLIDFGIAKGTAGDLTQVSTINAATGSYAPLEQILRASEDVFQMLSINFFEKTKEILAQGTDERADIYALGVTIYQLLTNRTPANAHTRALAVWSGQSDKLIPANQINADVPEAISNVLQKAMSIEREGRFATAAEMRTALREAVKPAQAEIVNEKKVVPQNEAVQSEESEKIDKKDTAESDKPAETKLSPKPIIKTERKIFGLREKNAFDPPKVTDEPIVSPETDEEKPNSFLNRRNFIIAGVALPLIILSLLLGVYGIFFYKRDLSIKTLKGSDATIGAIVYSPDGKTIASGDWDGIIRLWDASSGESKQRFSVFRNNVRSVAFSPDGSTIATSNEDDQVLMLLDAASGKVKPPFIKPDSAILSIAYSPDGKLLAGGCSNAAIKIWDAASGNLQRTLQVSGGRVIEVRFSPDGKTIAGASDDETVKIFDADTGELIHNLKTGSIYTTTPFAYSPDSKIMVTANGGTILLWNASTGALIQTLYSFNSLFNAVAFSPDGKTIIADGGNTFAVLLFDAETRRLKQTLTGHTAPIAAVAFSPDGKTLASSGFDKTIKLWRVE
jgi:WD40 repeat protein/predicted Ser/Thr protein kinase